MKILGFAFENNESIKMKFRPKDYKLSKQQEIEEGTTDPKKKKKKGKQKGGAPTLRQLQTQKRHAKEERKFQAQQAKKVEKVPYCDMELSRLDKNQKIGDVRPIGIKLTIEGGSLKLPVIKPKDLARELYSAAKENEAVGQLTDAGSVARHNFTNVDVKLDSRLDTCKCQGYLIASLDYDDSEDHAATDLIIAHTYNIKNLQKGFAIHFQGDDSGQQIHVEVVAASVLDQLLTWLRDYKSGKTFPVGEGEDLKYIRFALSNLSVDAQVRYYGSQTSVCKGCRDYWANTESKWKKLNLRRFKSSVEKGGT